MTTALSCSQAQTSVDYNISMQSRALQISI